MPAEKPTRLKMPSPDARSARSLLEGRDPTALFTSGGAPSTNILTIVINILDTETVTINGKVYTWNTILGAADGDVIIGVDAEASLDNLVAAINLDPAGSGVQYAAAMTLHPTVSAADGAALTVDCTAKFVGSGGDALTSTEGIVDAGAVWSEGATFANGVDPDPAVVFVPVVQWKGMRVRVQISDSDGELGVEFARPARQSLPGAPTDAFVYTADQPAINATALADGVEQSLEITAGEHIGENWLKVSVTVDSSLALLDFLDISGELHGLYH